MVDNFSLMAETPEETKELVPSRVVKTETNFASLPFFALSRQDAARRTKTEYRVMVERDGQRLEALWRVTSNIEYGYPRPFDRKVHKAIEYIINEQGIPIENPIPFSLYHIIQILDIRNSGKTIREIKRSLRRILHTAVDSEGTFYSKAKRQYISDSFHIYDRVVFKEQTLPNGETAETNYLFLSQWYLDSINSFYVRPIDFEYFRQLRSDIAGRLYEFLGVRFYGVFSHSRPYWRVNYHELCDLLPITPQRYYSKARDYLGPAHRELKRTGFLADFRWEKESRNIWYIKYYPGKRAKQEFTRNQRELGIPQQLNLALREPKNGQEASEVAERQKKASETKLEANKGTSEGEQDLKTFLIERGVGRRAAARLVKKYATRRIAAKVEIFDWIQRNQPDKINNNPAGYLRRMIEEDWPAPQGFRTKAEEEEIKRRNEERSREIQRQIKEADFREWQAMTPEEKVRGELLVWRAQRRRETGLYPTNEETEAKKQELISSLPSDEEYRRQLFGEE